MSYDSGSGCLGQIVVLALMFFIVAIVSMCEESQSHLIKDARNGNSVGKYETYLDKYPSGKFATEAYNALVHDWDMISLSEVDYSLSRRETYKFITRYNDLLDSYSDERFNDTMQFLMNKKCKILYNKALKDNTIEAWNNYIEIVPGDFEFDAKYRLKKKHDELWGTESLAWGTASATNTSAAYDYYTKLYPKGKHYSEAEKKSIQLQVDDAFKGTHGDLPPMDKAYYGSGAYSTVSVTNSTGYALTLLYSGKEAKKVIIPSNGQTSVRLKNGTYRIAASVSTSNVIPYAGVEELSGGGYDVDYYIQTRRY